MHSLRELRDIVLDCTVAPDERLNIAVDSCSLCRIVPMNYFRLVQEQLLELQRH